MSEITEELLPIGLRLRFVLFGLECAFGVSFNGVECERVFRDAAEDQVSAKRYLLFESPGLIVSGLVEEYEPVSIWLRLQGGHRVTEVLLRVIEAADFHAFRLRESAERDKDAAPRTSSEGDAAVK